MSESKGFIKNISSNYFIFGLRVALGIYALPVCLHAFGLELYGLYIISFGLSSSMAAFDLGSSKSIFRYAVEYNNDANREKFQEALNVSLSFNFFASILIFIAMITLGYFSELVFNTTPEANQFALPLFILAAINALLLTTDAVPQNLLIANKHFHSRNTFQFIFILLNLALLLTIQFGNAISIITFATCTTLLTAFTLLADVYLVYKKRLTAMIKISLIFGRKLLNNRYTGYSLQVFGLALVSFLAVQADRIIIAGVLDVAAVTVYTIITKPYFVLRGIIAISFPVIQPTLNKLNLETTKENFAKFTGKIIRTGFLVMLGVTLIASIFYDNVLTLWLGTSEYNSFIIWGMLSLVTLCITMLYSPYYRTLVLSNQIKIILNFSIVSVICNVIISIILSNYLGFQGVIIGTFIQIIAECIFSYKWFVSKLKPYNRNIFNLKFIGTSAALILITLIFAYFSSNFSGKLLFDSIYFVLLTAIVSTIVYAFIKHENVFAQFSPANDINTINDVK